jgi:hypothetical protein
MRRNFVVLGLGILAGALLVTKVRERRQRKVLREVKENMHRWEDEGGNVPEVATVSPRPKRSEWASDGALP